jgi:hypothetical protein
VGSICLGHDQKSGGVLVQPVDNTRSLHAAYSFKVRHQRKQCIHQRTVRVAGAWMNGYPRWLINHQHVRVLKNNGYWHGLGFYI